MKKMLVVLALALVLITGCFKIEAEISVNPDGSGQIISTVGMDKETFAMVEGMGKEMMGGATEGVKAENPFSEETFKKQSAAYGEGVEFVSFSTSTKGTFIYFNIVYSFKDINKIKMDPKEMGGAMGGGLPLGGDVPLSFSLAKNELTMKLPFAQMMGGAGAGEEGEEEEECEDEKCEHKGKHQHNEAAEKKPADDEEDEEAGEDKDDAEFEMAKQFIKDMYMSFKVSCGSAIVETNATFVEGNKIIIAEIDGGKMLQSEKKLKELQKKYGASGPPDKETMKKIMSEIPGFKMELGDEVKVKFK